LIALQFAITTPFEQSQPCLQWNTLLAAAHRELGWTVLRPARTRLDHPALVPDDIGALKALLVRLARAANPQPQQLERMVQPVLEFMHGGKCFNLHDSVASPFDVMFVLKPAVFDLRVL
jgi:hypothetical protein